MIWVILLLLLNIGISWWNARVAGQAWDETKALGGFIRLVVWSAAIQSAIGFSMGFLFVFGGFAYLVGWLPPEGVQYLSSLFYLLIIVPVLGTGLIITIHSWIVAYRERDLLSMGVAAYNTFAQVHNTVSAFNGIGSALDKVSDMFKGGSSDDAKGKLALLVILIAVCALLAGTLLTVHLIQKYRGTVPLPSRVAEAVR